MRAVPRRRARRAPRRWRASARRPPTRSRSHRYAERAAHDIAAAVSTPTQAKSDPTGRSEERQGQRPAALFFRAARRRVLAVVLAVGATIHRWLRRYRPYRVLRIELSGTLPEVPHELRLRDFGRRSSAPDLLTLLATLRSAREDPELALVVLDVHGIEAGWGRFRACGARSSRSPRRASRCG